jgi:hypothetical protein
MKNTSQQIIELTGEDNVSYAEIGYGYISYDPNKKLIVVKNWPLENAFSLALFLSEKADIVIELSLSSINVIPSILWEKILIEQTSTQTTIFSHAST